MRSLITFAVCLLCTPPVCAQTEDLALKAQRGRELMAAGKFEEAIPVYRDLTRALPDHPGPLMNLGLALHMAGHPREALVQFHRVLELEPTHLPAHLFLGTTYMALNEPANAIEPLRTVIRVQPDNREACLVLGQAFLSLKRFEEAVEQFQKLSELTPSDPKVWNGLGLSYEALASRNFEELEKLALGSAYWFFLVAEARAKADQLNSAFFFYRQAQANMPGMRGIHPAVAEIYRKTGHPDWAAIEEKKERQLHPLDCDGAGKAGAVDARRSNRSPLSQEWECDFRGGRYQEVIAASSGAGTAEAYFWRARAYNELARLAFLRLTQLPPSAQVHELVAKIHYNRKNYTAAAKQWQSALEFAPGNPQYRAQLAISLSAARNYDAARPLLEDLVEQSPDSLELNYWLGFTLLGLVQAAEAIPFLEKAVKVDPTLLEAHRDLARAYLQVGQADKAVPHLKAALPIDEAGSLYYQLARAYRMMGRVELENEMLEKFRQVEESAREEKKALEKQVEISAP